MKRMQNRKKKHYKQAASLKNKTKQKQTKKNNKTNKKQNKTHTHMQ